VNSRRVALAVAAVSVLAATAVPATASSAEARTATPNQNDRTVTAGIKAHVNSNVDYTWLYSSDTGDAHGQTKLFNCFNFYYDYTSNGRYHAYALNGWVSMDKAGAGWCFD
jgi:hypothetical protein